MFPILKESFLVFKMQEMHRDGRQYMSSWNIMGQSKKTFYTEILKSQLSP